LFALEEEPAVEPEMEEGEGSSEEPVLSKLTTRFCTINKNNINTNMLQAIAALVKPFHLSKAIKNAGSNLLCRCLFIVV
jgi:hypothetical protein